MHGVTGKPPGAAKDDTGNATSRIMLLLLVAMNGVAPISLYILVPALPMLATTFGRDISVAQMTVSLYMVGLACSQIIMGPLSDRFGRRPALLAGLGLMVVASVGCIFAETLPQLIAARFLQALGGATGMVVSRAIIRDLYPRERVGAMISLVIAVMMIAQMLSPLDRRPAGDRVRLARDLLRHHRRIYPGCRGHRAGVAGDAPRPHRGRRISRRCRQPDHQPRLHRLCAVPGAGLADHFRLRRRRTLSRGHAYGPLQRRIRRVVCHHRVCLSGRQPLLRALRSAPFAGKTDLVRARAATRSAACSTCYGASPA